MSHALRIAFAFNTHIPLSLRLPSSHSYSSLNSFTMRHYSEFLMTDWPVTNSKGVVLIMDACLSSPRCRDQDFTTAPGNTEWPVRSLGSCNPAILTPAPTSFGHARAHALIATRANGLGRTNRRAGARCTRSTSIPSCCKANARSLAPRHSDPRRQLDASIETLWLCGVFLPTPPPPSCMILQDIRPPVGAIAPVPWSCPALSLVGRSLSVPARRLSHIVITSQSSTI